MKKFLLFSFILVSFLLSASPSEAYVSVGSYIKKNGTYVAPSARSNPNGLKYDNYGYKPSQAPLNPTYGTRGTSWDTPTYITDPNYYQGKQIYDSLHSGASYSPGYTIPSNTTYTTQNNELSRFELIQSLLAQIATLQAQIRQLQSLKSVGQ